MAKRPQDEDPRVTDLRRYRKEREQAKRKPPPRPPSEGFLGSNPRAGLILALFGVVILLFLMVPLFF